MLAAKVQKKGPIRLKTPSILIKAALIGFLVGFLLSDAPGMSAEVLPLSALLVLVGSIVLIFEVRNTGPAAGRPVSTS